MIFLVVIENNQLTHLHCHTSKMSNNMFASLSLDLENTEEKVEEVGKPSVYLGEIQFEKDDEVFHELVISPERKSDGDIEIRNTDIRKGIHLDTTWIIHSDDSVKLASYQLKGHDTVNCVPPPREEGYDVEYHDASINLRRFGRQVQRTGQSVVLEFQPPEKKPFAEDEETQTLYLYLVTLQWSGSAEFSSVQALVVSTRNKLVYDDVEPCFPGYQDMSGEEFLICTCYDPIYEFSPEEIGKSLQVTTACELTDTNECYSVILAIYSHDDGEVIYEKKEEVKETDYYGLPCRIRQSSEEEIHVEIPKFLPTGTETKCVFVEC